MIADHLKRRRNKLSSGHSFGVIKWLIFLWSHQSVAVPIQSQQRAWQYDAQSQRCRSKSGRNKSEIPIIQQIDLIWAIKSNSPTGCRSFGRLLRSFVRFYPSIQSTIQPSIHPWCERSAVSSESSRAQSNYMAQRGTISTEAAIPCRSGNKRGLAGCDCDWTQDMTKQRTTKTTGRTFSCGRPTATL